MKKILVTGAAGGMGKETIKYLSKNGYYIYALDIKEIEDIENVKSFKVDLTNTKEIESVYDSIKEEGNIDGIVFLNGMYYMDSLVEINEDTLRKVFDINFFSVFNVNKIFFPILNPNSRIIITTSEVAPLDPLPFNSIYSLSKSTLETYAKSLRQELNLLGIKVIILRPGAVETTLLNSSIKNVERIEKETTYYKKYAKNFKNIVEKNESKIIKPIKISILINKILSKKKPKLLYKININPKLKLLSALPDRLQLWIIKKILNK